MRDRGKLAGSAEGSALPVSDDVDIDVRGTADKTIHERPPEELLPARTERLADHDLGHVLAIGETEHPFDRVIRVDDLKLTAQIADEPVDLR